jgi:hypothetical protein
MLAVGSLMTWLIPTHRWCFMMLVTLHLSTRVLVTNSMAVCSKQSIAFWKLGLFLNSGENMGRVDLLE